MMNPKVSILYLDDEAACLDLFDEIFRDEYDVRIARTGAEARRALLQRPSDIVVSDQTMPGLKGTDFLREVAEEYPRSARVMLTGSICLGAALPELSAGVVNIFISKPWGEDDMTQALRRASLYAAPPTDSGVNERHFSRSRSALLTAQH